MLITGLSVSGGIMTFILLPSLSLASHIGLLMSTTLFVDTKKIQSDANKEIITTPIKVKKAMAGNYSGMIGAALLAFEKGI